MLKKTAKQELSTGSYSTLLSQLKKVFIQGMQRIEEEVKDRVFGKR